MNKIRYQVRLKSIRGGTPLGNGYSTPTYEGWWCHVLDRRLVFTPQGSPNNDYETLSLDDVARVQQQHQHQQGEGYHLGRGCEWFVLLEGNGVYLILCCENRQERDELSSAIAYFSGPKSDRAGLYNEENERISLPK